MYDLLSMLTSHSLDLGIIKGKLAHKLRNINFVGK